MNEAQLARQIMELLDLLGSRCYYVRIVSSGVIGREGRPRKGQPDIVGHVVQEGGDMRPFAWELKGPRGVLAMAQQLDLERAAAAGAQAVVIRSLDEAIGALRGLGIEIHWERRQT